VSQTESAQYNGPEYQEDECCEDDGMRTTVSKNSYEKPLNRNDEQGPIFEAVVLRQLMKESDKAVCRSDDDEDDTLMEYCSEEEEGGVVEVDSDDE